MDYLGRIARDVGGLDHSGPCSGRSSLTGAGAGLSDPGPLSLDDAQPAIPSATVPPAHHAPKGVFAAGPANTTIARWAHSRFCVPSPAVTGYPILAPMRRLTTPGPGSRMAVPAVRTRPTTVVSAWPPLTSARIASTAI
jgi:hypothetical protein